ncbi:MAG TPA: carboxypeptidase-like regulatory domain-containing protein, partial [Planctomycetota bacterium]|nr:carboxypeptidase-like regulatory domain-containing protein [Planctomycetota bacterium]
VAAEGHEERELGPFDPSALPELVECVLAELPGVRGRVLAGGAPRAGACVSLTRAEECYAVQDGFPVRSTSDALAQAESDAEGRFMATLRERGSYYLRVEAAGFAALEVGPLDIDPARGRDLGALELSVGGAIEGRVLAGPDGRVAGAVVAISRGDGHARTQRVGPDGSFRFQHLIPGPWWVELRDKELIPGRSSYESRALRKRARIPSNCSVTEGGTTPFDLVLDGRQPCRLKGTLHVDGAPAAGWTASLHDAEASAEGLLVGDESELARTGPDGVFRLSRVEPGRYRLVLAGGADANFCTELELDEGTTTWFAAIELATLDVEGLPMGREQLPSALLLWERGQLFAVAPLFAAEDGAARGLSVPAGKARIVRFEPQDALSDPRSLPTWLALELPAGETMLVRVP